MRHPGVQKQNPAPLALARVRRPFNDSYLWRYSNDHVSYEIEHFFWLAPRFDGPNLVVSSGPSLTFAGAREDLGRLRNLLIEGAVVHLRNIIDFIFLPPTGPTDVVAADFCVSANVWEDLRGPISDSLKKARRRANKEIAHLTTDRQFGDPPEKSWNFLELATELKALLLLLPDNALPNRLAPSVATAVYLWDPSLPAR